MYTCTGPMGMQCIIPCPSLYRTTQTQARVRISRIPGEVGLEVAWQVLVRRARVWELVLAEMGRLGARRAVADTVMQVVAAGLAEAVVEAMEAMQDAVDVEVNAPESVMTAHRGHDPLRELRNSFSTPTLRPQMRCPNPS